MSDSPQQSRVQTRGSAKRGYSDVRADTLGHLRSGSSRTVSSHGGLKRARLSAGTQRGGENVDSEGKPENPCALCEKTILAQQDDLDTLQRENIQWKQRSSWLQGQMQHLETRRHAFGEDCREILRALNDCQEKMKRLQASLDLSAESAHLTEGNAEMTRKSTTFDPTWTHNVAPTGVDSMANGQIYGDDLFAIHDGNLFDLPPMPSTDTQY